MSYMHKGDEWDQTNIIVNKKFSFQVAIYIIRNDENLETQNENVDIEMISQNGKKLCRWS